MESRLIGSSSGCFDNVSVIASVITMTVLSFELLFPFACSAILLPGKQYSRNFLADSHFAASSELEKLM